jgi:hypothetical protein
MKNDEFRMMIVAVNYYPLFAPFCETLAPFGVKEKHCGDKQKTLEV